MVQETWNLLFVMSGLGFMIGNRFGNNDAGNICRSPSAEAVFRYLVEQKGLASDFVIDSAGTINYHEGNPADSRMRAAAMKRGVKLTSISRPIRRLDFEEFDLILAMDKQNKGIIALTIP
jgi:protein-tyrosine phosphatase